MGNSDFQVLPSLAWGIENPVFPTTDNAAVGMIPQLKNVDINSSKHAKLEACKSIILSFSRQI